MFWAFLIVLTVCSTLVSIVAMKSKHLSPEIYAQKRMLLERQRAEMMARTWDYKTPERIAEIDMKLLALAEQMPREDDED